MTIRNLSTYSAYPNKGGAPQASKVKVDPKAPSGKTNVLQAQSKLGERTVPWNPGG
jgi:hypothetical protein